MCSPKHVRQLRKIGIINSTTRLHLVDSFYEVYITMHGSMNIKFMYHKTSHFIVFISRCLRFTSFCASQREPIFKQGVIYFLIDSLTSNVQPSFPRRQFVRISDCHYFGLTIQLSKAIKTLYTLSSLRFSYGFYLCGT